ncbi:gas vesicle protein GvpJ [Streptacidiphilus neutrinimicus]|uniref:gas vesicle protein GvpJ n=1 Tax=Streptacidiphilus neutrinimicus TaxID=105420 RepID=UPI0005A70761|nr:gas vesicle protein GvpJ [Streptacidiphilus neutrinimicus]
MTVASQRSHYLDRPQSSGLVDVIDLILDKGLVIDVYVRVSLVGIELLTIDARIVVASVDTYLRFAEAVNRLDLAQTGNSEGLPELVQGLGEKGAKSKTKGALEGAQETVKQVFGRHGDEDEEEEEEERPRRRSRTASARRERER